MLTFYIELYNSTRWLGKDVSIFPIIILEIICLFQEVWHNIVTISPYVEKGEQT